MNGVQKINVSFKNQDSLKSIYDIVNNSYQDNQSYNPPAVTSMQTVRYSEPPVQYVMQPPLESDSFESNKPETHSHKGLTAFVALSAALSGIGLVFAIKDRKKIFELLDGILKKSTGENGSKEAGQVNSTSTEAIQELQRGITTVTEKLTSVEQGMADQIKTITNRIGQAETELHGNIDNLRHRGIQGPSPAASIGQVSCSKVSIWDGLELTLPGADTVVERSLINRLKSKTESVIDGTHLSEIQTVENPRIASISYEGLGGGAESTGSDGFTPHALKEEGCDVFGINACFSGRLGGKEYSITREATPEGDKFRIISPKLPPREIKQKKFFQAYLQQNLMILSITYGLMA